MTTPPNDSHSDDNGARPPETVDRLLIGACGAIWLVFLVVGPAVDIKLIAMQSGIFGRAFAIRFAPTTFVVATVVGTVVGLVLLGGRA